MNIDKISPTHFQSKIVINSENNKNKKYLFNEMTKLAQKYNQPGEFHTGTGTIKLHSLVDGIKDRLNDIGVNFEVLG